LDQQDPTSLFHDGPDRFPLIRPELGGWAYGLAKKTQCPVVKTTDRI